ncbi:hypothetical protein M3Y98_00074100 [Aphelenchoides besseyi]|nr:hypothetical protein M3Y98_00074100 [Aphelenchoides besseyi]
MIFEARFVGARSRFTFFCSYDSVLAGHRVIVTPSPPASVCSETPRTRRRRLFLNRSCATLRESFCIRMSEDQKAPQEQEELSELRKTDQTPIDSSGNQKTSNRGFPFAVFSFRSLSATRSRESSDTDLVHLTAEDQTEPQALHPTSELPHDVNSMPKSVSAERIHEHRETGPVDSKPVDPNPYLQLKQPSDLKGPHVDEIKREPTDAEEVGRGILATLLSPRVLIEVAAIGVLIGVYLLYKRR